jgi:methylmalonyl-CoA mutase N-terminal domain/subunit
LSVQASRNRNASRIATGAIESWRTGRLEESLRRVPPRRDEFTTLSGIPVRDIYTAADTEALDEERDLGLPGDFPFTRGIHASMYRARPWTIRQVAGFGQAEDTNQRYKYLLAQGETGLSTDFDLPTLLGYDSDHPVFTREVGKIGVAVDTVDDVHALFADIPLEDISVSLTINGSAAVLLAMYRVVADERSIPSHLLTGTLQNDILKEYTAQNEFIFPPDRSVNLVVDTMEYTAGLMPRFNPVSVSGYHIRDAGSTAVEEVAMTLASAVTYLEQAIRRGISPDRLAPRLSFFFDIHNDFFEEIAKFRAARRLWARLARDRLGCQDPRSWMLRTHAQTAGVSLTAQQPLNNIVRTTIQALAGVLGGVQSMHTNSLDEAFAIPSEEAIKVAVRTQQILLHETGTADVVDPLGGSFYLESLTDEIEARAVSLIDKIDDLGGMVACVESGFLKHLIGESSWEQQAAFESEERITVGVNRFADEDRSTGGIDLFRLDPGSRDRQLSRLAKVKETRDERRLAAVLQALSGAAMDPTTNVMPHIEEAVRARGTVGEICDMLRGVWGEYRPSTVI